MAVIVITGVSFVPGTVLKPWHRRVTGKHADSGFCSPLIHRDYSPRPPKVPETLLVPKPSLYTVCFLINIYLW